MKGSMNILPPPKPKLDFAMASENKQFTIYTEFIALQKVTEPHLFISLSNSKDYNDRIE